MKTARELAKEVFSNIDDQPDPIDYITRCLQSAIDQAKAEERAISNKLYKSLKVAARYIDREDMLYKDLENMDNVLKEYEKLENTSKLEHTKE